MSRHYPTSRADRIAQDIARQKNAEFLAKKEITVTAASAMDALRAALKSDPEYAWSWHCAIWAGAHDEGLETGAANRAAARVMHMAFGIDTSKHENFEQSHREPTSLEPPIRMARALWEVLREVEDEDNVELEQLGASHVVWQLANVALKEKS